MTLDEAGRDIAIPKAILHPIGGDRLAAFIARVDGGIVFAEPGFAASLGLNRLHLVEGTVEGPAEDGPWTVGGAEIRLIDHGDDLVRASNDYQRERKRDTLLALDTWENFVLAIANDYEVSPIAP